MSRGAERLQLSNVKRSVAPFSYYQISSVDHGDVFWEKDSCAGNELTAYERKVE